MQASSAFLKICLGVIHLNQIVLFAFRHRSHQLGVGPRVHIALLADHHRARPGHRAALVLRRGVRRGAGRERQRAANTRARLLPGRAREQPRGHGRREARGHRPRLELQQPDQLRDQLRESAGLLHHRLIQR